GPNPDLASPGVALDTVTGRISVTSNTGSVNDLTLDADDLDLLAADGTHVRAPFASEKLAAADGESVRTQLVAFDSLGAPFVVDVGVVLSAKTAEGTTWRYYVESGDDSDLSSVVATGELRFDTSGRLLTTADVPITVDLAGSGALTPQTIAMNFGDATGGVSALADGPSQVFGAGDGSPFGTLIGFNVDRDGLVIGSFDNGEQRLLGQVALATFINPQGLVDEGDNLFRVGANSGPAAVTTPGLDGSGRLVGGALEFSNVDLGREFINMILASTGYTASSRVISTTDEMLQNLVALFR
ncbi:MAG: flagellar hook-basal body complex protein, partial [Actinobacteria bacterium]|nr:flagellar hook-basal body complex protein [Actinomycetota bacterium]